MRRSISIDRARRKGPRRAAGGEMWREADLDRALPADDAAREPVAMVDSAGRGAQGPRVLDAPPPDSTIAPITRPAVYGFAEMAKAGPGADDPGGLYHTVSPIRAAYPTPARSRCCSRW